ncbi:MAG: hypothetical protein FD175_1639 [Beijerinckiaceae bacterium]|nr:MAG: hypothetical protein FD175_1639 [Beijerinckiaceae bacterium]
MAIFSGFLTSLLIAGSKGVVRIQTAMANRRAAKELLTWDEQALKDIGLTRSDVRGALATSFHTDPTHSLSLIAAGYETRTRRDGANRPMPAGPKPAGAVAVSKGRLGNLPSAEPVLCA